MERFPFAPIRPCSPKPSRRPEGHAARRVCALSLAATSARCASATHSTGDDQLDQLGLPAGPSCVRRPNQIPAASTDQAASWATMVTSLAVRSRIAPRRPLRRSRLPRPRHRGPEPCPAVPCPAARLPPAAGPLRPGAASWASARACLSARSARRFRRQCVPLSLCRREPHAEGLEAVPQLGSATSARSAPCPLGRRPPAARHVGASVCGAPVVIGRIRPFFSSICPLIGQIAPLFGPIRAFLRSGQSGGQLGDLAGMYGRLTGRSTVWTRARLVRPRRRALVPGYGHRCPAAFANQSAAHAALQPRQMCRTVAGLGVCQPLRHGRSAANMNGRSSG